MDRFYQPPPITDLQPVLDVSHVLQGQGIDPGRARPGLVAMAQDVIDEAQSLLDPAAVYVIVPVQDFHHRTVVLEGDVTFEGPLVARALAGATQVAAAVCTIGSALEERVETLFQQEPVRAMALDGAGVGALRVVSEAVVARIREEACACELGSGMRASPGQEGWSIWQQRELFRLVPAEQIGVRLAETCLMLPRKSVSFVIGMGPEMRPDAVTCDFCSKRKRCPWRIR